jgi:hypothetical protein
MAAPAKPVHELPEKSYSTEHLDRVYTEASQWVRLVNTIIWSMGTLLVPVSFGFVGLALNKSSGAQYEWRERLIFIFSFWVTACRIYKHSTETARKVLINIETVWKIDPDKTSFFRQQEKVLKMRLDLFKIQIITLVALILVWIVILVLGF